ncbi:MAG TPA: EamA family transporter [Streptosporangiaceae bacterium]|nr:EamA family transporter [Streptosporangiaceae bacterium]
MIGHQPWPAGIDAGLRDRSGGDGSAQSAASPARRDRPASGLRVAGTARRTAGTDRAGDGRRPRHLTAAGPARKRWPPAAAGAALIVGSALAFALDGPVAQAAYQQGLDPATFGFWRAAAGALVLGGYLATRLRPGALAGIRRMRRAAAIRLALAAVAGLGLNLALFEAFARLPVAVAVAAFGCYPLFVAACEAVSRRPAAGAVRLGMAVVAIAGLMLLIRPDRSVSVPVAGLLLALLAAVLHAAYILLGRGGWDQVGDGTATFLIVATAAVGLGVLAAATRPAAVLAPVTDLGHTGLLLLLEGVLAGAAAPLLFLAGLRRIGATQTAVLSLCEPLAATLLAAVLLGQLLAPSQLLGGALLLSAGIAVQTVPARPARRARDDAGFSARHLAGGHPGGRPPDATRRPEAA